MEEDAETNQKAIVVVFVVVQIAGEVKMVHPDVVRFLDTNGISSLSQNFGNDQVADDYVIFLVDAEPNTRER